MAWTFKVPLEPKKRCFYCNCNRKAFADEPQWRFQFPEIITV